MSYPGHVKHRTAKRHFDGRNYAIILKRLFHFALSTVPLSIK